VSATIQKCYLLDGPLILAPERKQEMAEEMAALLLDANAYLDRGDAIRLLRAADYNALNVMLCVDDARHLAMQEIIAKEMSEP
jgi:hypothetical protein